MKKLLLLISFLLAFGVSVNALTYWHTATCPDNVGNRLQGTGVTYTVVSCTNAVYLPLLLDTVPKPRNITNVLRFSHPQTDSFVVAGARIVVSGGTGAATYVIQHVISPWEVTVLVSNTNVLNTSANGNVDTIKINYTTMNAAINELQGANFKAFITGGLIHVVNVLPAPSGKQDTVAVRYDQCENCTDSIYRLVVTTKTNLRMGNGRLYNRKPDETIMWDSTLPTLYVKNRASAMTFRLNPGYVTIENMNIRLKVQDSTQSIINMLGNLTINRCFLWLDSNKNDSYRRTAIFDTMGTYNGILTNRITNNIIVNTGHRGASRAFHIKRSRNVIAHNYVYGWKNVFVGDSANFLSGHNNIFGNYDTLWNSATIFSNFNYNASDTTMPGGTNNAVFNPSATFKSFTGINPKLWDLRYNSNSVLFSVAPRVASVDGDMFTPESIRHRWPLVSIGHFEKRDTVTVNRTGAFRQRYQQEPATEYLDFTSGWTDSTGVGWHNQTDSGLWISATDNSTGLMDYYSVKKTFATPLNMSNDSIFHLQVYNPKYAGKISYANLLGDLRIQFFTDSLRYFTTSDGVLFSFNSFNRIRYDDKIADQYFTKYTGYGSNKWASDITVTGIPTWDTIRYVKINFATDSGAVAACTVLVKFLKGFNSQLKTAIYLSSFDDIDSTVKRYVTPMAVALKMPQTYYLVGRNADSSNVTLSHTVNELLTLQNNHKFTIASHTYRHTYLIGYSPSQQRDTILEMRNWLYANKFRGFKFFGLPGNGYNEHTLDTALAYNDYVRAIGQPHFGVSPPHLPGLDWQVTSTPYDNTTLNYYVGQLVKASIYRTPVVTTSHGVLFPAVGDSIRWASFKQRYLWGVAKKLEEQNKLIFLNFQDFFDGGGPVITGIEPTKLYFKGDFLIETGKVATWNADTVAMASETDSSFILTVTPKGNNLPDTLVVWAGTVSLTKIIRYDDKGTKLVLGVK